MVPLGNDSSDLDWLVKYLTETPASDASGQLFDHNPKTESNTDISEDRLKMFLKEK